MVQAGKPEFLLSLCAPEGEEKYENEQVTANMMLTNLHLGINDNCITIVSIRIMIRQPEFRGFVMNSSGGQTR